MFEAECTTRWLASTDDEIVSQVNRLNCIRYSSLSQLREKPPSQGIHRLILSCVDAALRWIGPICNSRDASPTPAHNQVKWSESPSPLDKPGVGLVILHVSNQGSSTTYGTTSHGLYPPQLGSWSDFGRELWSQNASTVNLGGRASGASARPCRFDRSSGIIDRK